MTTPKMFEAGSRKRLVQGAIFGAIATITLGFGWGGWILSSSAERMANERVVSALVIAYAPVCVDLYNAKATPDQRAEFLKDEWNRGNVIGRFGFATVPGFESPERDVAKACADAISKLLPEKKAEAS
jgi:hypothetical protein